MTGADIARRSRRDQGLAEHVEDQGVLAQIVVLAFKSVTARRHRKSVDATNAGPNQTRRSSKTGDVTSDASAA
jgi:hypothetical protein